MTNRILCGIIYTEIKKGGANMANRFFEKVAGGKIRECKFSDCPDYLYIDDTKAFYDQCGDTYITENVFTNGVYMWENDKEVWKQTDEPTITRPIMDIIKEDIKEVGGITRANSNWNIEVLLDDDTKIKTNDEPVPIDDVIEAIKTMLKPSFFGKRLKGISLTRGD